MGHFTYWRYSRPVSANFSTRSPPIGDFCSVRSSLGIPFGSRNWRVGSGCSFSPASGCGTMSFQRLLTQHTSEAMHVQRNDGQSNTSGKSLSTYIAQVSSSVAGKSTDLLMRPLSHEFFCALALSAAEKAPKLGRNEPCSHAVATRRSCFWNAGQTCPAAFVLFFLMKFGSVRGDAHAHIGGDRRRSIAFRMELII